MHDSRYWNRLRAEVRREPHLSRHEWSPSEIAYLQAGIKNLRDQIHVTETIYHRWKEDALKNDDSVES